MVVFIIPREPNKDPQNTALLLSVSPCVHLQHMLLVALLSTVHNSVLDIHNLSLFSSHLLFIPRSD